MIDDEITTEVTPVQEYKGMLRLKRRKRAIKKAKHRLAILFHKVKNLSTNAKTIQSMFGMFKRTFLPNYKIDKINQLDYKEMKKYKYVPRKDIIESDRMNYSLHDYYRLDDEQ